MWFQLHRTSSMMRDKPSPRDFRFLLWARRDAVRCARGKAPWRLTRATHTPVPVTPRAHTALSTGVGALGGQFRRGACA